MGAAGRPRGSAESLHELGDGEPVVVGAPRVRRAAGRHPRHRQVARAHRSVLAERSARLLRRDRVGGAPAVVQRPRRPERHLLLRDDAMAGREPAPAVARGDDPLGRRGRHVPRLRLSRRDLLVRVRRQLVQQPHGAPPARATAGDLAGRVRDAVGVGVHAPQPRQRLVPRTPADLGEHRRSVLQRRQLERDGAAPARQQRELPARGFAAQEAPHPRRHALPRLLHEGSAARPAPLPRPLAEGRRHRNHARAAGEAPHPQGRSRQRRVAAGAGLAAPADALDEVLSPAGTAGARR